MPGVLGKKSSVLYIKKFEKQCSRSYCVQCPSGSTCYKDFVSDSIIASWTIVSQLNASYFGTLESVLFVSKYKYVSSRCIFYFYNTKIGLRLGLG